MLSPKRERWSDPHGGTAKRHKRDVGRRRLHARIGKQRVSPRGQKASVVGKKSDLDLDGVRRVVEKPDVCTKTGVAFRIRREPAIARGDPHERPGQGEPEGGIRVRYVEDPAIDGERRGVARGGARFEVDRREPFGVPEGAQRVGNPRASARRKRDRSRARAVIPATRELTTLGDHLREQTMDLGLFQWNLAERSAFTAETSFIGRRASLGEGTDCAFEEVCPGDYLVLGVRPRSRAGSRGLKIYPLFFRGRSLPLSLRVFLAEGRGLRVWTFSVSCSNPSGIAFLSRS